MKTNAHTEEVGNFTITYGATRATPFYGEAGNSRWADREVPYTITSRTGEVIARGECTETRIGARRHAQRMIAE